MSDGVNLWSFIAWALLLMGAAVSLWIVIGRPSSRPHCPKCGYSMEGARVEAAAISKCPECGHQARRQRDLVRRERRLSRLTIAAALMLAAYGSSVVPRVMKRGWVGAIPTPALVMMTPWMTPEWHNAGGAPPGILRDETDERLKDGEMRGVWGWVWAERTRWSWWVAGRSGVSVEEAAGLERLARATILDDDGSATFRESFEAIAGQANLRLEADWASLSGGDEDPQSIPTYIASLSGWTALDCLCRDESNVFSMSAWTVRDGSIVLAPESVSSAFAVFDTYDLGEVDRAIGGAAFEPSDREGRYLTILNILTTNVESAGWVENGGMTAQLELTGGRVSVVAPAKYHVQIRRLLDAIRRAGVDQPKCAGRGEEDIALARRLQATVLTPPTGSPTLREVATAITERVQIPHALHERLYGLSGDAVITGLRTASCAETLDRMCGSFGTNLVAEWSVLNGVILIRERARSFTSITRIYNVADLLRAPQLTDDRSALAEALVQIDPEVWADNGGDQAYCQFLGDRLVISAPPAMHVEIEELLAKLRTVGKPPPPR